MKQFISKNSRIRLPVIALALGLLVTGLVEACPTCKDGLGQNSANLVRGFGWSIIFMMSMPFLVFGGIGGYFYLEIRRGRREMQERQANANQEVDISDEAHATGHAVAGG